MGLYFTNREDRESELAWMSGIRSVDGSCALIDDTVWDVTLDPANGTACARNGLRALPTRAFEVLITQLREKRSRALLASSDGGETTFELYDILSCELQPCPDDKFEVVLHLGMIEDD